MLLGTTSWVLPGLPGSMSSLWPGTLVGKTALIVLQIYAGGSIFTFTFILLCLASWVLLLLLWLFLLVLLFGLLPFLFGVNCFPWLLLMLIHAPIVL